MFSGLINQLLSWRGWLPFSRLSYCIYMTQALLLLYYNTLPPHWDNHFNWVSIEKVAAIYTVLELCSLDCEIDGHNRDGFIDVIFR